MKRRKTDEDVFMTQAADVKAAVDEAFFKEIHHGLIEVAALPAPCLGLLLLSTTNVLSP